MCSTPYKAINTTFHFLCRLQVPLDSNAVAQSSGVAKTMYKNARATLQKALGIRQSFTARDLCISFGCARYETSIRTTLSTFKHRYLDSLQEQTLKNVDLSRPVFLAAAFFLVTKQNKVKVQKDRLLSQLGVTSSEFSMAIGSFLTFMPELEATNPSQKKTKDSSSGKERKRKKNLSTNKDNDTHQGNGGNDEEGDCGGDSDTENENGSRDCLSDQDENANDISSKKKKRLMTEETLRRIVLGESNSIR